MTTLEAPGSTPGGDGDMHSLSFLKKKFDSEQLLLLEAFFDIFRIFVVFSAKVNLLPHSNVLKYLKNGNLF